MAKRKSTIDADTDSPAADAAATSGVGTTLREARERRGWKIADAAQYLRIRAELLEAMEAGRFEKLPTGAYALGFVRTYADFLGLDRNEIIRRVKAEAAAVAAPSELSFPQPVTESRLPSGVLLLVSAVIAAAAYGLWYFGSARNTASVPRVEAVPERLAPAKPASATPEGKAAEAAAPSPTAAAPPPPPAAPAPVATSTAAASPPSAPPPAPAAPASPPAETPPAAAETAPPAASPAVAAAPAPAPTDHGTAKTFGESEGARVLIKAGADSWVQIRDPAGTVVFSRILRRGDSYAAPNKPGYRLATGSAGALEITVDGQRAPSLGPSGITRHDVILDPARLLAGTAVPEPPPPRRAAPAAPPAGLPRTGG